MPGTKEAALDNARKFT